MQKIFYLTKKKRFCFVLFSEKLLFFTVHTRPESSGRFELVVNATTLDLNKVSKLIFLRINSLSFIKISVKNVG